MKARCKQPQIKTQINTDIPTPHIQIHDQIININEHQLKPIQINGNRWKTINIYDKL